MDKALEIIYNNDEEMIYNNDEGITPSPAEADWQRISSNVSKHLESSSSLWQSPISIAETQKSA